MSSSEPKSIISAFQRVTVGGHESDFGIPQSPPSTFGSSPWKLQVNRHRDNSPTRVQKSRAPAFDLDSDIPRPANMRRRASCPDFTVPDFKLSEGESARLLNKRPSIVSQSVIEKFQNAERIHVIKTPAGATISELPEMGGTDFESSPCPVALTDKPKLLTDNNTAIVPSQQKGFLMSKVSTMFTAKQPSQKATDFTAMGARPGLDTADIAGGGGIMPPKKKSYFARRAAAITNADMNTMAPTSL